MCKQGQVLRAFGPRGWFDPALDAQGFTKECFPDEARVKAALTEYWASEEPRAESLRTVNDAIGMECARRQSVHFMTFDGGITLPVWSWRGRVTQPHDTA